MKKEEIIEIVKDQTTPETYAELLSFYEKEEAHENYIRRRSITYELSLDQENEQSYMIEIALANRQISTVEQAYQNWLNDKLRKTISQLSSSDQAIIDMLFYLDLTEKEAAECLGIKQQSLNERKHRILRDLKKKLKKYVD